jgi:hypothetical protein
MVGIEFGTCLSVWIGGPSPSWTVGKGRLFASPWAKGQALCIAMGQRGGGRSLLDQESVGGDAERGVVMESSPASSLEMGETEFALEFPLVAFDPLAQFGGIDEHDEGRILRQG